MENSTFLWRWGVNSISEEKVKFIYSFLELSLKIKVFILVEPSCCIGVSFSMWISLFLPISAASNNPRSLNLNVIDLRFAQATSSGWVIGKFYDLSTEECECEDMRVWRDLKGLFVAFFLKDGGIEWVNINLILAGIKLEVGIADCVHDHFGCRFREWEDWV